MESELPDKKVKLKCRFENDIRIVICQETTNFTDLRRRLSADFGFEVSLRYEDEDGDLIILSSQNDFKDLMFSGQETVNVIVSVALLPVVGNFFQQQQQQQRKLTTPLSAGGNWSARASNTPSTPMRYRTGSLERFPAIEASPSSQQDPSRPIRWKRGEILGQGAFGIVYLGLNTDSGELMAVKQMSVEDVSSRELKSLQNEINLLRNLQHPNIVRYIGTEVNPSSLSIFLEYIPGGSLKSLIEKFGCLEEAVVRTYSRQLLLGLEYLHRSGFAHRDIKGANCLVGNDGVIKLADFGASKHWRSTAAVSGANLSQKSGEGITGTPSWMAPEVIRDQDKQIPWKKADVWSLGCTILEMTTGKPPWHQFSNQVTVLYHIACSEALPEFPEIASDELTALLKSCLQRDPARRPDITSLLLFPFVSGGSRNSQYFTQRPMTVSTDTLGGIGEAANWRASSALMSRQGTAANQKPDMRQLSPEITTTGNALADTVELDGPYPYIETDVSGDCDDEVAVYDGERVNESDISAFDIENLPIRETIHGWEGSPIGSSRQTIAERRGLVISGMNLSSEKNEDVHEGGSMSKQVTHVKSMSAVPVIEYSLMIPALSPTAKTSQASRNLGKMFDYRGGPSDESPQLLKSRQQSASRTQSGIRRKEKVQISTPIGETTAISVVGGSIEMMRSSANFPSQVSTFISGAEGKKVRDLKDQNSKIRKMLIYDSDDDRKRAPSEKRASAALLPEVRRERAQSYTEVDAMDAASTLGVLRLEDTSSTSTYHREVENPWLVQSGDHVQTELDGHDAAIVKISMPKKTSLLLSASVDGILKIWNIKSGISAVAVLDAAKFTPSSRLDDKQEAKELSKVSKKSESNVNSGPVSMSKSAGRVISAWADDLCESVWAACGDGSVKVWSGGEGKPLRILRGHEDEITTMEGIGASDSLNCGLQSSTLVATGSRDQTIRIWDYRAKKPQCFLFRGHTDSVLTLKWAESGRAIVSGSKDKTMKIWDTRAGRMRVSVEKHFGPVTSIRVVPESVAASLSGKGRFSGTASYITSGRDSMLHFWSTDGECVGSITAHRGSINAVSEVVSDILFSPATQDSPLFLTSGGGADAVLKLWDAKRLKILTEIPAGACSKLLWIGQTFVSVSNTGALKSWNYHVPRVDTSEVGHHIAESWFGTDIESPGFCSDLLFGDGVLVAGFKTGQIITWSRPL